MSNYETDLAHFHERFLALEDELNLFDLRVDGVPVWERVRAGVGIDLLDRTGLTGTVHSGSPSFGDRLRALYLLGRNLVVRNPFFADSNDLVFLGLPRRKRRSDGWWDIYSDPIHEAGDFDALHLESARHFQHYRPAKSPNLRYTDLIRFLGRINAALPFATTEFTDAQRSAIERAERRFAEEFGVDVRIGDRIRDELESRRVTKPLWDRLLDRLGPSLAVVVAYSGEETFLEACHDAGVPVAELQHGQICPYSYQHAFPGDRTKHAYPDYLLAFGEFWKGAAAYPIDDDRILPVGYPYLEREADRRRPFEREGNVVFVSTPEAGPKLSRIAADVAGRSTLSHDVVYKLHPDEYGDWGSDYPWLVDAPVTVVAADGPSLYDLFAAASAQVGVGSTALYEGLAFDLSTFLVRLPTVEWLAPAIENGEATVVESADELADHLSDPGESSVDVERYFAPDAVENAITVIEDLRENGTLAECE